jgi:hypothetical protein
MVHASQRGLWGQTSTFDKLAGKGQSRILHISLEAEVLKATRGYFVRHSSESSILEQRTHQDRQKSPIHRPECHHNFHFLLYTLLYSRVKYLRTNHLRRHLKFLLYIHPVIRKDNFMNTKNDSRLTPVLTPWPASRGTPRRDYRICIPRLNVLTRRRHPPIHLSNHLYGSVWFAPVLDLSKNIPISTQLHPSPAKST